MLRSRTGAIQELISLEPWLVLYHILDVWDRPKRFLRGGEHMASRTLFLAALIALGLGGAFAVSTVSSVSVQAATTN
jgi:hypothetical protein